MHTTLVTGATGNVGSAVVGELAARGVPVRAFVRDPARAAAALGPDLELAVGDFADPASIRAALEGIDVVFLACGNLPPQVEYETNVIEAAARAGVRRLVKLSALGAEPGSRVAFWDWHARIERHLEASGIPSVILRPRYYMTNLLGFVETIRAAGAVFAPAEGVKVPMIDPRDVAATAAAVASEDGHEGRTYELTGPEPVTFSDVAAQLSEVAGRPVGSCPSPTPPPWRACARRACPAGWPRTSWPCSGCSATTRPPRSPTPCPPSPAAGPATWPSSWPTTRPCSRPDRRGADYGPVLGGRFAAPTSGLSADGPPARSGRERP